MTLCPTRAWEQAMRGIRAIAEERHRKSELAAAFEAVKSYTAETLWRELGREPALRKFIEAYAQRIVALGQQLVDKKDLLKRSLDEISDDGDEGKAVALTILQAGAKGDTERVVNLLFELERLGANDPRRSGAIDWLRGGLEREIMGYKVVEAPRTVPSYQCPGCSAQLSEHLRQVKSVRCPQCDSHEYHSGILRMPVSSQDGSSSVAVVPMGAWWEPVEPEGDHSSEAALKAVHSADFTMVDWFGTEYQFALGVQSSAVRALWEEWEKTGLGLHQETIREAIDAERDSFRMDTAFRNHDAFGTMIQRCGDGRYKLARPDTQLGSATPKTKRNTKRAPKSRRRRA